VLVIGSEPRVCFEVGIILCDAVNLNVGLSFMVGPCFVLGYTVVLRTGFVLWAGLFLWSVLISSSVLISWAWDRFVGVASLAVGLSSVVGVWKLELISCSRLVSWSELVLCRHIGSFELQKFIICLC
jgi:hypothetical protein